MNAINISDCTTPPLGVKPDFLVISQRNIDLAEAIIRYCQNNHTPKSKDNLQSIKRWASEIVCNCDTQLVLLEKFKNTMEIQTKGQSV